MHTHSISRLHDVVIAGAGPVGLFLSCELALADLDVLVLERDELPAAPLKSGPLGTRGLSIATAEALHRRGLLEALLAAGAVRAPQAGHFASIAIDAELRARWLVGCDGGRSAVRKLAGFEFAGTEPEFTAYSALVDIADPERLEPGRHATPTGFYMSQAGRIAIADFDGGAYDRDRPVTREHLQAVLRRVSGAEVTLSALHLATTFTDRARLATRYRRGRVLLAGDAAHVHSALGGQGLNAGLGDAMNLGWKLAANAPGRAPDGLLDTYESERRPVGQWLLDWTRAQVAIMRPDAHARALEGPVRQRAATRDGATHFAGQLWGVALRHELGVGHPLAGRSTPDLAFDDGRRLGDQLRDGRGVLVDLAGSQAVRRAALPWDGRVRLVTGSVRELLGLGALLVRPDGVVAWASDRDETADGLAPALARWFGAATA